MIAPSDPSSLFRPGLLGGVSIVLAGAPGEHESAFMRSARDLCSGLRARVASCAAPIEGEPEARERASEAAVEEACRELASPDMLAIDGGALFAALGGRDALVGSLQSAWDLSRAFASQACIGPGRGARLVLVAPAADAGEHADAARAGLENLARTLSIEWARYAIGTVAIAPGPASGPLELAGVIAYLASPAGSYFSGCLLDLRGPGPAAT